MSFRSFITKVLDRVILSRLPVRENRIVFILSRTHEDNSLVLFDYLYQTEGDRYEYCFVVQSADYAYYQQFLKSYRVSIYSYKANPYRALKMLTTAKYLFFMRGSPLRNLTKKKEQLAVNLWHGSGYKDVFSERDGTEFDCVMVPGEAHILPKARFFSCAPEKVLPLGYPRYDLFRAPVTETEAQTVNELFRRDRKKLVIWMPTFRSTGNAKTSGREASIRYSYDLPLLNSLAELQQIDAFCREQGIVILIKRHPNQKRYSAEGEPFTNICFADNGDLAEAGLPVYRLLNATDGLISDYSSVAIDYLLLDRPMAFALDDFEQYKNTRGFVFDDPLQYMPGHHLYCLDDMLAFLRDVAGDRDPYRAQRQSVTKEIHNLCDNYSERIWKTVREMGSRI